MDLKSEKAIQGIIEHGEKGKTRRYYHVSPLQNKDSIIKHGLKASKEGVTFLCTDPFETFFHIPHQLKHTEEFIIITVELNEEQIFCLRDYTVWGKGEYCIIGDIPRANLIEPIGLYAYMIPRLCDPFSWIVYNTETKEKYAFPFWLWGGVSKLFNERRMKIYKEYCRKQGYSILETLPY